jgi:hypothetical protein
VAAAALVSAALPYGFISGQTEGVFRLGQTFSWFCSHDGEWYLGFPAAFVLSLSSWLKSPSHWIYWLYALHCSLNIGLFALVGSVIFRSRRAGFILAVLACVLELSLMRSTYFNLQIAAQPLYSQLLLSASLLTAISFLWHSRATYFMACALFGIAAITVQPEGCAMLIFGSLCAALYSLKFSFTWPRKLLTLATCFMLLFGPTILSSLRNLVVYGYAQPSASQGLLLLADVLPLTNSPKWFTSEQHLLLKSKYFRHGWLNGAIVNAIQSRSLDRLHEGLKSQADFPKFAGVDSDSMFVLADAASRIAASIIEENLDSYALMCLRNYIELFSCRESANPWITYQESPDSAYQQNRQWAGNQRTIVTSHDIYYYGSKQHLVDAYFQRISMVNANDCDPTAVCILNLLHNNPISGALQFALIRPQFIWCHLALLSALVFVCFPTERLRVRSLDINKLSLAILCIVGPAALNLLYIACFTRPSYDYLIESELSLHLGIILMIGAICLTLWDRSPITAFKK